MAKKIIEIGVQGNDGTGDSIRDAFSKVNANFDEIYSIFGLQGTIPFSQLADGCTYTGDQLIVAKHDASGLEARDLIPGRGMEITVTSKSITLTATAALLSNDTKPLLNAPLNVNGKPIGALPNPSQEIVDLYNLVWDVPTTLDQLPVTVGYANSRYARLTSDGTGRIGVLENGIVVPAPIKTRDQPLAPEILNPAYDPSLTGNYLSNEVLPRKDVVYRGGDTMTGKLILNDHPGALAGTVGASSVSDLQAATTFYVDNKTFSSNVNLYVSVSSGDDLQLKTPAGKEGRFWNYSFKSIGAALLYAESLINLASQEPGPYKQRISYTNGADQTFSTIQRVTLTDGQSTVPGYVAAFNLLQTNRTFIQAETVAYINKKYVNKFTYNRVKMSERISELILAVSNDLVLGSTNPDTSIPGTNYNSYWSAIKYLHDDPTLEQSIQWLAAVNFIKDQLIEFTYDSPALQLYTNQLVTAFSYDLLFSSNYLSIEAGIAFKTAGTKISASQLSSMLTINPITIKTVSCVSGVVTLTFLQQPSLFLVGTQLLVDAKFTNTVNESNVITILPSQTINGDYVITPITVTGSTLSSISFATGSFGFVNDGTYTVAGSGTKQFGTIDRKNLINLMLLTPSVINYPSSSASIKSNAAIIQNIITSNIIPAVSMPSPSNPVVGYNVAGHSHAKSLLLENIPFIQAEVISFLSSEYPLVSYNRQSLLRDITYIVWSICYDLMYGGNSQSVYIGQTFWSNGVSTIRSSEKAAYIASVNYINTLAQAVISNSSTNAVYQQSVRQYRNDTLTNGIVASASISANVAAIAAIINNLSNAPVVVLPPTTTGIIEMQNVYSAITNSIETYTTGTTTSTSWYMDKFFPVIKNTTDKDKINSLLTTTATIVAAGRYPSTIPTYPIIADDIVINTGITNTLIRVAHGILTYTAITTIGTQVDAYIAQAYPTLVYDSTILKNDVRNILLAGIYDLTYGGTTASFNVANTITLLGTNVQTQKSITLAAVEKAWDLTNILLASEMTGDPSNTVANKLNQKVSVVGSFFGNNPPTTFTPVDFSLFTSSTYTNSISLKTLITSNTSDVVTSTLTFIDTLFVGGFNYDESLCYRDVGLIIDSMAIDLITGGTYQSINAGKSYYKNSSAKSVAIGTEYTQSLDGIMFAKDLALQVLNKELKSRFQQIPQITQFALTNPNNLSYISTENLPTDSIGVTGDRTLPVSSQAIATFTANMLKTTNIIEYGISVAETPSFGSGIWNVLIDNGGNGYVDQGSPVNNDLFPAKVVVGVGTATISPSTAYGSIVSYSYGQDLSGASLVLSDVDTLKLRLTRPGFFKSAYTLQNVGWTYVGTTVTVTKTGHSVTTGTRIVVNIAEFYGAGTNAPTGTWIVSAITANTFSFVVSNTPTGTSTTLITTIQVGEQIEFGETVPDLQITMFVESGIYYEDYPMRLSASVSIKGDEFRRTIIRPKDRISQSPWRKIFFYRDAIIDALEVGLIDYNGTNYAPAGISASFDGVTNKIIITLSNNYQALLSWVGKVIADTNIAKGNSKRGKAVIDSVSGNTINCTVIYPFSVNGVYAPGTWKLFGTINYGRHYLTNPLDITSAAKNNKDIDVFLCNEGNRITGITFQGHGGFAMVLDPEGNIKTKSPYIQECSSFSQSNNHIRFAGGMFIDGFAGRLYGNITGVSDNGITVTVQGETNSGLDVRPPQPPCSFYVRGKRYQIDDIVSFSADTKTVVLTLDKTTPYLHTTTGVLTYNDNTAKTDIGYVIDAITSDAALGTNFRSVNAGRSFLSIYTKRLVGDFQDLIIAGINQSLVIANSYISGSTYASTRTTYGTNITAITDMIANGANATPTIIWADNSDPDTNLARNIIQSNKAFIKSEISAFIAATFTLSNYPKYNVLTSERDIGYVLDSLLYDMSYGGDSQTKDSAETLFLNNASDIPDENTVFAAGYTRLKEILALIVAGSVVTPNAGNGVPQVLIISPLAYSTPTGYSPYVTKLNTLSDILIDYIPDGTYSSPRSSTRTYPTLPVGTTNTTAYGIVYTDHIADIKTSISTYLKNGANLRINLEAGGNRSMLGNDFAMLNDLAYGVIATNGAFSEQVCTFTYYAHTGLWSNNGSNIRGVGCSNTFGNYGMRASGYDVTELPDSANLANHMIQTARVYKQGVVSTEMIPTATVSAIAVWIIGYDYIPTNGSILEIDHSAAGGTLNSYTVTSAEYTSIQVLNQVVLKLNLNTSDTGTGAGLTKPLYDGQLVTLRSVKSFKFVNIDNVKPTRPSTALQYNDSLNDVYRIISYNLSESTGDLLGNNIAILQSDNSFAYYNFTSDTKSIINGDPDSSIYTTVVSGSTSSTTLEVTSSTGVLLGHVVSGIGFTGQTITNISGTTLTLSSAPSVIPYGTVSFSFKTQGSKVGDTKIAVSQVSQLKVIDQINKGTYITAWNGRLHRVLRYVTPKFSVTKTYVSYASGTLVVSGSAGSIELGSLIIKRNSSTNALELTGTVGTVIYDSGTATATVTVINPVVTILTQGSVSFGVASNGYLEIAPNAFINNAGTGTPVPALGYVGSVLQTGSTAIKVVTFDIPFSKDNVLPKVDSYISIAGNSNSNYNGEYQVVGILNQTEITLSSIEDFAVGMVVTSQVNIQSVTNSSGISTLNASANHNLELNDPVTANITSSTSGFLTSTTYYVKTKTATSFTLSSTVGGTALGNFGINITSTVAIIAISSSAGVSTFTTNSAHGLNPGDTFAPNISTNGFLPNTTYYIKTAPTSITFTLSLTSNGAELGNFGSPTDLLISVSLKTPQTATIPGGSAIIQSVSADPLVKTIVISPASWVPANAPIRASLAANVVSITINTGGAGYTSAPTLIIEGGSPTQRATATCSIVNGVINEVRVIIKGSGYTSVPTVTIIPAVGNIPSATAILSVNLSSAVLRDATSSVGISTTRMSLLYATEPGTFGTNTPITTSAATISTTTYNSIAGYSIEYTVPSGATKPANDSWCNVSGNSNALYNGFFQVISTGSTAITLFSLLNPGTYGTGTTIITDTPTTGSTSSLGISKPFSKKDGYTFNIGYPANTFGQVTTRISTCRATGHDFCDIGTGGYSTTNIPYSIYGEPALSRQVSRETLDESVGRCFYVSTNQDGIFRVGKFFSVDQGTGVVTLSSKTALSNIEAFGFSGGGAVVNQFSTDSTLTDNSSNKVPVESAVRGYIDRRLGVDHGGSAMPFLSVIGPGFLPLNGSLKMTGDLLMGGNGISGVKSPVASSDVVTKGYLDQLITANNSLNEADDVLLTAPVNAQSLFYDDITSKWKNATISGDITAISRSTTTLANVIVSRSTAVGIVSEFTCESTTGLFVGQQLIFSGSYLADATGSITGYSPPTTYFIIATNGTTTFQIATVKNGTAVVAVAGTLGLTVTVPALSMIIGSGRIVNSMISSAAKIEQSKLLLNLAGTSETSGGSTGIASFNGSQFTVDASGWVSLNTASSETTGVTIDKLQRLPALTVLSNITTGSNSVVANSATQVVAAGEGIQNGSFTSVGVMTTASVVAGKATSFAVVGITTTGEASKMVKTGIQGEINVAQLQVDNYTIIETDTAPGKTPADTIVLFSTPAGLNFLTAVGDATASTVKVTGTLDVTGATSSVKTTRLTTGGQGITGEITGAWTVAPGSTFDLSGSVNVSSSGLLASTLTPQIKPSLLLDFANSRSLDPRISFTRNSNATYYNSAGLMVVALAGQPRFGFDPVTKASKGLLIEERRVNLLCGSASFATTGTATNLWNDSGILRTLASGVKAPDGTTAIQFTTSAVGGNGTILNLVNTTGISYRTFSIWLGRVSGTGPIQYTLDNGNTWTTVSITSTLTRYSWSLSTPANVSVGIRIVTSLDSIVMWGAQLEGGSFASSYIPTTTTTVAREADVAIMVESNFSRWYNSTEGTLQITHSALGIDITATSYDGAKLQTPDLASYMGLRVSSDGAGQLVYDAIGVTGAAQFDFTGYTTSNIGETVKHTFGYKLNDCGYSVNNSVTETDTTATISSSIGQLAIGGSGSQYIERIAYYTRKLTGLEIQAISAQ